MRAYTKKSESRTLGCNPRASKQAPMDVILQGYKQRNIQKYSEGEGGELIPGKFDTVQCNTTDEDEFLQGEFESTAITSFSSLLQRKVETSVEFIQNMRTDKSKKDLYLYTNIMSDGLGDAGQLRYLKSVITPLKENYNIDNIISLSTYDPETKYDNKYLKDLSGSDVIMPVSGKSGHRSKINPKDVNWEIEYPVPDPIFDLPNGHLLKVKEMGTSIQNMEKTGEKDGGIGYGIPNISNKNEDITSLKERGLIPKDLTQEIIENVLSVNFITIKQDHNYNNKLVMFNNWGPLKPYGNDIYNELDNAWLISYKKYAYSDFSNSSTEVDYNRVTNQAKGKTKLLIQLGSDNNIVKKIDGLLFFKCKNLPNPVLEILMNIITDGVIISGGEGLFVESMGTDEKNQTATILAGRYNYQYKEIAYSLSQGYFNSTTVNDNDDLLSFCECFGIVKLENNYITYYDNKYIDVLTNKVVKIDFPVDISYSKKISALYFPLSLNGDLNLNMPYVFKSFGEVKDIYLQEKLKFKEGNWFNLFQPHE